MVRILLVEYSSIFVLWGCEKIAGDVYLFNLHAIHPSKTHTGKIALFLS